MMVMDETMLYLVWSVVPSIVLFIYGMCHKPVKIYKETKRKKYRRMAEQALKGQPAFPIKPLTDGQKETVLRKLRNRKWLLYAMLIWLWFINIAYYAGIFVQNLVDLYFYIIALPLQIILTAVFVCHNEKKYKKVVDEIDQDQFGVLYAKVLHHYTIFYSAKAWYSRKYPGGLWWHFFVSTYVDEDQKVCCYNRCIGYTMGRTDLRVAIDVLMYKGRFAGYGISDKIKPFFEF